MVSRKKSAHISPGVNTPLKLQFNVVINYRAGYRIRMKEPKVHSDDRAIDQKGGLLPEGEWDIDRIKLNDILK